MTEDDRPGQFLIAPESQEPENRAEASAVRAQTLNHQVEVHVETSNVSDVDETFFKDRWDVVVAAGLKPEDIFKVNLICRKLDIKFFATNVFGMFGFFFSDLLDKHVFRKPVRGIFSPYGGKEENMVIRSEQYVPFDYVVNHKFDKVYDFFYASPWYFAMRGLLKYVDKHGCTPTKEIGDFETVRLLVNDEVASAYRRDDNKVPVSYIQLSLGPPVPVICQMVGSMLVKEIIKAGTHVEEPYNNVYLFDPVRRKSEVAKISGR
uniref:SUMO-activating enzyme subunit 1 n=1 Tax=Lygus hesperus TaxID=30085 RepID=A0A0A9YIT6_LYGHE